MILLENIAEYLENQGFGTRAEDIFIGFLGDFNPSKDNIIMIDQTGGIEPDKYLAIARPTIQITVRNKSHQAGIDLTQKIFDLFHQMDDLDTLATESVDIMNVMAINEPQHLLRDDGERDVFTCTFIFRLRRRVWEDGLLADDGVVLITDDGVAITIEEDDPERLMCDNGENLFCDDLKVLRV